jgi:hypothetical protein
VKSGRAWRRGAPRRRAAGRASASPWLWDCPPRRELQVESERSARVLPRGASASNRPATIERPLTLLPRTRVRSVMASTRLPPETYIGVVVSVSPVCPNAVRRSSFGGRSIPHTWVTVHSGDSSPRRRPERIASPTIERASNGKGCHQRGCLPRRQCPLRTDASERRHVDAPRRVLLQVAPIAD